MVECTELLSKNQSLKINLFKKRKHIKYINNMYFSTLMYLHLLKKTMQHFYYDFHSNFVKSGVPIQYEHIIIL